MIAAYLLPFPIRGHRAPYLWIYYRLLTDFDETLLFICSNDYHLPAATWDAYDRWEMQAISSQRLDYEIPDTSVIARHHYAPVPDALFIELLAESDGNPVASFRRMLTERIPSLEATLEIGLSSVDNLEAVLTWCNCPSLSAAAERLGIPVLHLEMGPLRWPLYRPTAYLDFHGVNGYSEAEARYHAAKLDLCGIDNALLRNLFCTALMPPSCEPEFDIGVPLQVEDDSNLVAYGHGYDNQSLLIAARLEAAEGQILARSHPGSLFRLKPDWYTVDTSQDSVTFVRRCRRILTVNSSVGLEAILYEVPVRVLGDCAYRFVAEATDSSERARRLAYFLLAYLVPMAEIFNAEYLRFRLSGPDDSAIVARHLAGYGLSPMQLGLGYGHGP